MDELLSALLSYQFVLLCLAIAAVTYVIRLLVEFFILDNPKMPGTRASKLWRDVLLPIAPYVNGILIGVFIKSGIYPNVIASTGSRIEFALVAGSLSGLVYRVISGVLKSKLPPVATVTTVTTIDPSNASDPVSTVTTVESDPKELDKLAADVSKTINKE